MEGRGVTMAGGGEGGGGCAGLSGVSNLGEEPLGASGRNGAPGGVAGPPGWYIWPCSAGVTREGSHLHTTTGEVDR